MADSISFRRRIIELLSNVISANLGAASVVDKGTITADVQGIAATPGLRLVGWAVTESTGSAVASFVLRRGTSAAGARITPLVNLAAGEAASDDMPEGGVAVVEGVFVDVISGSIDVLLYSKVVS